MPEHSPEPWIAQPAYNGPEWSSLGEWFVHSGPWLVATIHAHHPSHSTSGNAHLIKASPALLRTCRLQQKLIDQLMPHVGRMNLDDFDLLATAPQEAALAIQMASPDIPRQLPQQTAPAAQPSCDPHTASDSRQLRKTSRKMLRALKVLLPAAEQFERQASAGSGGRRGGELFAQVRKIIREAEGAAP